VVGIKYKMDLLERLAVTQFPRKLIAPTYLEAFGAFTESIQKFQLLTSIGSTRIIKRLNFRTVQPVFFNVSCQGSTLA